MAAAARLNFIEQAFAPAIRRQVAEQVGVARGEIVAEMIGRYVIGDAQTTIYKSRARVKSIDETVPDYEFWDKLRRGKLDGYKLGALFAKRVEVIFAAWVLGRGVTVSLAESGNPDAEDDPRNYTDGELARFLESNKAVLLALYRDHMGLGDQYVIVNADGSLSVPSPDTVTEEHDPLDYRAVTAVRVETRLGEHTVIDEYRAEGRTLTVQ